MIRNLQVLRAFAALLVVVVHCDVILAPTGFPVPVREAFACGVDLFFVISGFVMVYTTSAHPPSSGRFLLGRIARVVPLYWFLTLATFTLVLIAPLSMRGTRADMGDLLQSLFFVPYARTSDGMTRPILFVGWSLNYEMFFYLVFAAGLFLRAPQLRVAAVIGVLALLVVAGMIGPSSTALPGFLMQPVMLEFAAGMLVGHLYPILPRSRRAARIALALLPFMAVALILSAMMPAGVALAAISASATILLVLALILERAGIAVRHGLLLLLGDASYSLYLTHPFVTQAISMFATRTSSRSTITSILLLLSTYVAVCIVAVVTYRLIERPLSRRARQLLLGNTMSVPRAAHGFEPQAQSVPRR
ncbi:acyltransferase [Sphingomonas sp. PP-CC-3A-396]|uniref:acyltransferase family protein n=1 Tax=Sphingomonas sp. PP-CC-3A-396 TaxID=2135655 RepID=UPI0010DF3147|nr:acyltransferase [Sphingomonas sp. PP-CC-3A-396]TCQ03015.1 peptidoglycan/LPS O-acetylase OafA/YrhL [Sphingomonas sp. PP-CC-3A-396]